MRSFSFTLLLLFPSICMASGDPAVLYVSVGVGLVHIIFGAVIMQLYFGRRIRLARIFVFFTVLAIGWFVYLKAPAREVLICAAGLAFLPALLFLRLSPPLSRQ